jgi:predicted amidohydrolase
MTRVAAIQMVSGSQVQANLAAAEQLIAEAAAAGARLIVLPENFALMATSDAERLTVAESEGDGPIQRFLATTARRHSAWLVGGTIPLRTAGAKVRAACLVYNEQGRPVARYDKIHLFDVCLADGERYEESNTIEPGEEITVLPTPAGRLGLAVCYDLRFPELFRRLLDAGAEIFALPSAFTAQTGQAHWETLVRARAIENLAYVIAPGQGGRHPSGRETHGDSMIVDPWGQILARRAQGAGIIIGDCDLPHLRRRRAQLPSLEHRKIRS